MSKRSNLVIGVFLIAAGLLTINSTNAQLCNPDPMYTSEGIFPDTATDMVTGCMGSFYEQTFTINVPPDTVVFGFNVTIVYMQVDSVSGLPAGLTYGCNPVSCQYPGNSSGCFQVYGIPSVSGVYNLTFWVHGQVYHPLAGNVTLSPTAYSGYQVKIGVHPTLTVGNIPATCNSNNAMAWVTPSGSSGYTYNWNTTPASANDTIFNQPAGIYQVTVNDLYNCATTDTLFINDLGGPQIDSIAVTSTLCFGDSTGSATAFVTGGTAPYEYVWSNGDTVSTMTGVPDGSYSLQVSDLYGCLVNSAAVINEPPQIFVFANHTDALCFGNNDGTASVAVVGGTGSYTYSWSSGDNTLTADSLVAGSYTITITDDNGCTATSTTTVSEPSALLTNTSGNDALCFGGSNGNANVVVSGGTPGYSYAWSNLANTSSTSGLFAGMYHITVTDTNGCSITDSVFIDQPPVLTLSFTTTPESMLTMLDGSIDATPGGGTPGYSYLWNNGQTTQDISGLAGGTYTLTLTDVNGCSIIDTITVQTMPGFGIEEEKDLFGFYPNPAHGFFYVEMDQSGNISLVDLSGKLVLSTHVQQGKTMIPINGLSKGVYMLTVVINNQKRVTKLIVD